MDEEQKELQEEREEECPHAQQRDPSEEEHAAPKTGEGREEHPDEQTKKVICSLAYLFGILFFLPLILYPEDSFARFHANQALVVLIATVVGEVVFGILCALLPILGILCGVFGLAVLIACIWAIIGVVKGEKRELPFIGRFSIIK